MSKARETREPVAEVPAAGRTVRLKDGVHLLRPLHPGDEATLIAFFRSHTEETIYYRYGYALRDMTEERARSLVGVDQSLDPALGVFGTMGAEAGELQAVGRYYLETDPGTGAKSGEVAFVTRESKRRCGMGALLLETLVALARSRKLSRLWGQVLPDNIAMLKLFERHGFRKRGTEAGSVRVELALGGK